MQQDKLFFARIDDAASQVFQKNAPKFLGFLDEEQRDAADCYLKGKNILYCFWGGYENAMRVMLGIFPDRMRTQQQQQLITCFPVCAVSASYNGAYQLSHRDFLGALMSQNITRQTLGDILVEQGKGVLFIYKNLAENICNEVTKIGRVGVTLCIGLPNNFAPKQNKQLFQCNVSSMRLDCLVAAVTNFSREKSAQAITSGLVRVNGIEVNNPAKFLVFGDTLSIRGKGKFIINENIGSTKKGRIVIAYYKYI